MSVLLHVRVTAAVVRQYVTKLDLLLSIFVTDSFSILLVKDKAAFLYYFSTRISAKLLQDQL